jgi:outer membrane protein OmpA-like peptidoglycan-associated protein
MRHALNRSIYVALLAALNIGTAQADDAARKFKPCPIIRDTEHPCWLAEYEGELYFLGVQGSASSAFYPPQFNHKALIEGTVADKPRVCGGIVLEPVKVSTMRELDRSCNVMLPAEGYVVETNERGPAPPRSQQSRRRTSDAAAPVTPARREFDIGFDFDMERPWINNAIRVGNAADYAKEINASRVEVIGYRGFARLTSGEVLEELPHLAELRANKIAAALRDIGIPDSKLSVTHHTEAVGPEPDKRRVLIVVIP